MYVHSLRFLTPHGEISAADNLIINGLLFHFPLQVVDARPKGRFEGTAPEPNPKIRSGHMLGSINFPFTNIIDPDNKTMKSPEGIREGKS